MLMVAPNTIESVPITVHVVPFGETEAAIVFPLRTSLTRYGGATAGPAVCVVVPLAVGRR